MATRRKFIEDVTGAAAGVLFTSCGLPDAATARAQTTPKSSRLPVMVKGKRVKTIDVHAHCLIPEALALLPGDEAKPICFSLAMR